MQANCGEGSGYSVGCKDVVLRFKLRAQALPFSLRWGTHKQNAEFIRICSTCSQLLNKAAASGEPWQRLPPTILAIQGLLLTAPLAPFLNQMLLKKKTRRHGEHDIT